MIEFSGRKSETLWCHLAAHVAHAAQLHFLLAVSDCLVQQVPTYLGGSEASSSARA